MPGHAVAGIDLHACGSCQGLWIPAGRQGEDGAYVRYVPEEMLGILALEAHRAGAIVVGEDLGTVEEGTREQLIRHLYTMGLEQEADASAGFARRSTTILNRLVGAG